MKTIVITGISRGIGKALAEIFLSNDYFVIGTSTSGHTDLSHQNLFTLPLDLSSPESINYAVNIIINLNKGIDILINNAGVCVDENNDYVDISLLRKTLEINLFGTIDFTEKLIPLLNQNGHILNMSSSAGSLSHNTADDDHMYPAYRISKTALNMYTSTLAMRLQGRAIISSVHPGWVITDMGGEDADITPETAAKAIYTTATKQTETGQFWFDNNKFPW
jgi:NAD(P)-dependent dehydrogenase (short-subunit alcohol dehydrogenase family)